MIMSQEHKLRLIPNYMFQCIDGVSIVTQQRKSYINTLFHYTGGGAPLMVKSIIKNYFADIATGQAVQSSPPPQLRLFQINLYSVKLTVELREENQ